MAFQGRKGREEVKAFVPVRYAQMIAVCFICLVAVVGHLDYCQLGGGAW